ncbi:MAG TPA: DNA polymerase IV, partial [Roseomonas sp.]
LDVTENQQGLPTASAVARAIRAEIRGRTGLTASAGVSYNKFLAKLASDMRKPDGLYVITPEQGPAFVEVLEVPRFHGVGPATAARMQALGIRTGRDLRERSLAFLTERFGKAGAHFHAIARGEDHRPVVPDRPRKSSGSETTYERDLASAAEVEDGIKALADEVWGWCERTGQLGRTVTLKLRWADFQQVTRSRTLAGPVASRAELTGVALDLVRGLFPLARKVRLLGVTVSGFDGAEEASATQGSFDFGHPG